MSSLPYSGSTRLRRQELDLLSSNLNYAADKRYNAETDLVADQNVLDGRAGLGFNSSMHTNRVVNFTHYHNLSAIRDLSKNQLRRDLEAETIYEKTWNKNGVALPKTKKGFFIFP